MADKATTTEEPSIEEILGSIRRIIAEDEEPATEPAEEPLELTNKIDPDGMITQTPIETVAKPEHESQEISFAEEETLTMSPIDPMEREEAPSATEQDLMSRTTAEATSAVLSRLARHTVVTEVGHDGVTLENIVREMLRPMLKDWLDSNLPSLVQKMVDRELERLTRRVS